MPGTRVTRTIPVATAACWGVATAIFSVSLTLAIADPVLSTAAMHAHDIARLIGFSLFLAGALALHSHFQRAKEQVARDEAYVDGLSQQMIPAPYLKAVPPHKD